MIISLSLARWNDLKPPVALHQMQGDVADYNNFFIVAPTVPTPFRLYSNIEQPITIFALTYTLALHHTSTSLAGFDLRLALACSRLVICITVTASLAATSVLAFCQFSLFR
jgi:hypothetical protein